MPARIDPAAGVVENLMDMYAVVHAFAYGRRGGRHAVVLSTHATLDEAYRALDALAADPPPGITPQIVAACYVVDSAHNPVARPADGAGE